MHHPVVHFSVIWLLGTFLILHFDWLLFAVSTLLLICLLVLFVCKDKRRMRQAFLYFLCFTLSLVYNAWHESERQTKIPQSESSEQKKYSGQLVSVPAADGDLVQFTLNLTTWNERVIVRLKLMDQQEREVVKQWRRGDRLIIDGTLEAPNEASNFGAFDYRRFLQRKRIFWQLKAEGIHSVQHESDHSGWNVHRIVSYIDQIRAHLLEKTERIFSNEHAGWMQGILIGAKEGVDPETYERFARLGISHLLAISGLHVGVMIGSLLWILRMLGFPRDVMFYMMCVVIPFYILLTGASPSVVRAGLMALAGLYAWQKGRLKDALLILSAVLWVMLLFRPDYLHDIGFQLSFAVTAGLIVGVPAINKRLRQLPSALRNALAVTIAAELVSFPLLIYYFHQYSLLSWLANLLLVPLVSIIVLPGGLAAMLLSFFSESAAKIASLPIDRVNDMLFHIAEWFDRWTLFHLSWPAPSPSWLLLYFAALLALFHACRHGAQPHQTAIPWMPHAQADHKPAVRLRWFMAVFMLLVIYAYEPLAWHWPAKGLVYFIDVGQGDASLVRTPTGSHLLIDGGGTISFVREGDEWRQRKDPFETGKDILVPLLKQRGVHQIDMLFLTHADADHVGGLAEVVKRIPVKQIFINGTVKTSPAMVAFIEAATERNIPIYAASYGLTLEIDRYTKLLFLHPFSQEQLYNETRQNDYSLVFLLQIFDKQILYAGDMEQEQEKEVLAALPELEMDDRANSFFSNDAPLVLKVAHHGSRTSTSAQWLDYWKPEAAVISAGRNNLYGHPHPDVIRRLQQLGSRVYRTDLHGEIQLDIRKNSMSVRTKFR